MAYVPLTTIAPYYGFTDYTPALPEFYWNVYSAEQRIKHICYEIQKLVAYSDNIADHINDLVDLVNELQEQFEYVMGEGFDEHYKEIVTAWINANFNTIMNGLLGHMLFFGLNDDGYFTAYIPEMWAITFDTDIDYNSDTYGCLEIKY